MDSASKQSAPSTSSGILRRSLRRQWKRTVIGAVFLGLWQLSEAFVPIAIGLIIDRAVLPVDRKALIIGLVGFALLFVVLSFSYRIGSRALNSAVNHEAHAVRVEVANHALTQTPLSRLVPGEVMSRSTADADSTTRVFSQVGMGVSAAAGFLMAAGYLLVVDWMVGVLVLIIAPLIIFLITYASRSIGVRSRQQQEAVAQVGAQAADIMSGLRVIKAIGGQRWASAAHHNASQVSATAAIKTASATGKVAGFGEFSVALILASVLVLSGWRVSTGDISVGQLVSIVGVAVYLSEPIRLLGNTIAGAALASGAAVRIARFLRRDDESPAGAAPPAVKPGRFYVVTSSLPGNTENPPAGLLAPHAADLFEGTLRSNITMSHDPALVIDDQVIRDAGLGEFVQAAPHGLDERVREAGTNLSGGQRQRVALARALYADPEFLVLQDPTSAVDSVTEVLIATSLRKARRGRTTVVYTSSTAFIHLADEVIE